MNLNCCMMFITALKAGVYGLCQMEESYLKSPLNYTGNKYRIFSQLKPYFPKHVDVFVDLFCGGATVGINASADKVIFVDKNERVISLLQFISKSNFKKLLKALIDKIHFYKLSCSYESKYSVFFNAARPKNKNNGLKEFNKNGFYKLRKDYNSITDKNSDEANLLLYLLLIYGFNNDLRFNSSGSYNLPCGKTDLNKNNVEKIRRFIEKSNESKFVFLCGDFRDSKIRKMILKADFLYADPPYLITDAVYNESSGWNEKDEKELISFLKLCKDKSIPFVLSNVLHKNDGKIINKPLMDFISSDTSLKVVNIDYHYRSASYNKKNRDAKEKEIIVVSGAKNA